MRKFFNKITSSFGMLFAILSLPIILPLAYLFGLIETEKKRGERVYRNYAKWKEERAKQSS